MGSIKGFIDWVKGSELEDDYEDEMPRQRNEEPAMDSEPSSYNRRSYDRSTVMHRTRLRCAVTIAAIRL